VVLKLMVVDKDMLDLMCPSYPYIELAVAMTIDMSDIVLNTVE